MLKANMKLDGKPCAWCQAALRLGDDAAVCTACEGSHHQRCWEERAGCATAGCMYAPLRVLEPAAAPAPAAAPLGSPFPSGPAFAGSPFPGAPPSVPLGSQPPPGYMICPACRAPILAGSMLCPMCRVVTSPDGIYHGPKITSPDARAALICGLIGLVFCNIILGPVAISKANQAKAAIAKDPTLTGEGLATAGFVLGIIDLALFAVYVLVRLS